MHYLFCFLTLACGIRVCIIALLALVLVVPAAAQPQLKIERVTVSWPEVEIEFTARCDGQLVSGLTPADIRLTENGVPITSFQLHCPDQQQVCRSSTVLLFDVSGSMYGSGNIGAQHAGHRYVDLMRNTIDEGSVMTFASSVRTIQGMTKYRPLLHAAVDSLAAAGATALWDGLYAAVAEAARGTGDARAVIVLTDGQDNASTRKPSDVLALATLHGIRVFAAVLGMSGYVELELLASQTGGAIEFTPNAGQLAYIYESWSQIIFQCFRRCTVRYESSCADGAMRDVALFLPGLCWSGKSATATFRAPFDARDTASLAMRFNSVHTMARREAVIQLSLPQQLEHTNLYPSLLRVAYDTTALRLKRVDVPFISLLYGVQWSKQETPGLVQLQTHARKLMHGSGVLFEFIFDARDTEDTLCSSIDVLHWSVGAGCWNPVVTPGEICVYPWREQPLVACDISPSQRLEWRISRRDYVPEPFTVMARFDNNGGVTAKNSMFIVEYDRSEFRRVRPDHDTIMYAIADIITGSHAAVAWDFEALHRSDPAALAVCIRGQFDNHPDVFCCTTIEVPAAGPVLVCGVSAPDITADPNRGEYNPMPFPVTATVTNSGKTATDSLRARIILPPGLVLAAGESEIKLLNTVYLKPQEQRVLQWMVIHEPTPVKRQYLVEVWAHAPNADSSRCEVVVNIPALSVVGFRATLQRSGPLEFCEGASVMLDPGGGYDTWRWNTGDSTRQLNVRRSGTYHCVLTIGGRTGYSDTVDVVVHPRPRPVLLTEGSLPLCPGDTLWIDAGADFQSYSWSNGLAVRRFPATRIGTYYVDVTDPYGCTGRSDSVTVTMVPAASIPVIARSGDLLETADAAAWQWRRNGADIPGATGRTFQLTETGIYTVRIVDANGCTAVSDAFIVNLLDIVDMSPKAFELRAVWPNPFRDRIEVAFALERPGTVRITLTDLLGREVAVLEEYIPEGGDCHRTIAPVSVSPGVYLLTLEAEGKRQLRLMTLLR